MTADRDRLAQIARDAYLATPKTRGMDRLEGWREAADAVLAALAAPVSPEADEGCPNYPATCRGCIQCRAEVQHDGPCVCDCDAPDVPETLRARIALLDLLHAYALGVEEDDRDAVSEIDSAYAHLRAALAAHPAGDGDGPPDLDADVRWPQ